MAIHKGKAAKFGAGGTMRLDGSVTDYKLIIQSGELTRQFEVAELQDSNGEVVSMRSFNHRNILTITAKPSGAVGSSSIAAVLTDIDALFGKDGLVNWVVDNTGFAVIDTLTWIQHEPATLRLANTDFAELTFSLVRPGGISDFTATM